MIIPNPVIKLDYSPANDILSVEWPDVHEYSVSEAEFTFDVIVETIRLYDVKYLLTDTRKGIVEVAEPRYKEMILRFARGLAATRLQKVARVVTKSTLREKAVNEARQQAQLAAQVKSFYNAVEAFQWLTSKQG